MPSGGRERDAQPVYLIVYLSHVDFIFTYINVDNSIHKNQDSDLVKRNRVSEYSNTLKIYSKTVELPRGERRRPVLANCEIYSPLIVFVYICVHQCIRALEYARASFSARCRARKVSL